MESQYKSDTWDQTERDDADGKKKKPAVLLSIWEEMQGLDRNKELRGSKVQTKCKLIQDWLKKPLHSKKPQITLRSSYKYSVQAVVHKLYQEQIQEKLAKMKVEEGDTHGSKQIQQYQNALTAFIQDDLMEEQLAAAEDIVERWNGWEGPAPETKASQVWVQVCLKLCNGDVEILQNAHSKTHAMTVWTSILKLQMGSPSMMSAHCKEVGEIMGLNWDQLQKTPPVDRTLVPLQVVRQQKYQKTPAPKYKKNPGRKNVKGKGKVQEEGVVDDSADDSADDSVDDSVEDSLDDSLDDHGKAEGSNVGTDDPSTKKVSGGRQNCAKTPFPSCSHSNPPPADGSHNEQLSAPPAHANAPVHRPQNNALTDDNGRESNGHDSNDEADEDTYLPTLSNSKKSATSLNTNPDLHSGKYADADGLESIPFTDLPTEEGSTSRNKGRKLKSALKCMHKASSVMLNQLSWLTSLHSSMNVKQGIPGSTWKSPCVRKAPARPDADVPSPDAKRSCKQTGSNQKQK
ncbi:hypothetical protein BKA82DRAFT_4013950 [Pisolithus tinctorius]|nr:hypothetical protein BKA82DRAFT_4013950 [Pisolithus tinctorius]